MGLLKSFCLQLFQTKYKMKRFLITLLFTGFFNAFSQELAFSRKIVDTLSSPYFWGRGYTKKGMEKAAYFLADQFKSFGLQPMDSQRFFQDFSYPVNTFPGEMELSVNGKSLIPGIDFIMSPEAKGLKTYGKLTKKDSAHFVNDDNNFIIRLADKLTWSVSTETAEYTLVIVDKKSLKEHPNYFTANIENKLVRNFNAVNVCGIVKGTAKPDSIILITAHYDHLGGMGKDTYFPGANDNASGVSLLLNLANYYAAHPQKYTIGFICFAGEEAGLIGSKFFTDHPLVPLQNIRFLLNTDLAGTGEDGITVVNATEFAREFAYMNSVNDEGKYLVKIYPRGKAANSDHYFFTEKGVPAFFFYTMGGIKAYHDVYDKAATLPLHEHEDLFRLIVKFNEKLMRE
jgi:aminopeptidase YwaD